MIIHGSEVRQYLQQFLEHYESLTSEDRHNRFFCTTSIASIRDWLLRLEGTPTESHIFNVVLGDSGEFAGVSQLAIDIDDMVGDVSLSVTPKYQRKGIGVEMIKDIISIAKEQDIRMLKFNCERMNQSCRDLFTKLGFSSSYNPTEQCVCGFLTLGE
jgi:GNAT superfamily N-acetyltransferase